MHRYPRLRNRILPDQIDSRFNRFFGKPDEEDTKILRLISEQMNEFGVALTEGAFKQIIHGLKHPKAKDTREILNRSSSYYTEYFKIWTTNDKFISENFSTSHAKIRLAYANDIHKIAKYMGYRCPKPWG